MSHMAEEKLTVHNYVSIINTTREDKWLHKKVRRLLTNLWPLANPATKAFQTGNRIPTAAYITILTTISKGNMTYNLATIQMTSCMYRNSSCYERAFSGRCHKAIWWQRGYVDDRRRVHCCDRAWRHNDWDESLSAQVRLLRSVPTVEVWTIHRDIWQNRRSRQSAASAGR